MLMKNDDKAVEGILSKITSKSKPENMAAENAEKVESGALQGLEAEVAPESIAAEEIMAALKSGSSEDLREALESILEMLLAKRGY